MKEVLTWPLFKAYSLRPKTLFPPVGIEDEFSCLFLKARTPLPVPIVVDDDIPDIVCVARSRLARRTQHSIPVCVVLCCIHLPILREDQGNCGQFSEFAELELHFTFLPWVWEWLAESMLHSAFLGWAAQHCEGDSKDIFTQLCSSFQIPSMPIF